MSGARLGDITIRVETWNPQVSGTREVIRYIDISSIDGRKKAIRAPVRVPAADAPSRARQIVRAGDVLVSTVRPGLNAVARIPSTLDGATASTGFCVLRPEKTRLNADYLFHWVRSSTFVRHLVSRATGANYPAVTDRVILDSKIPLPSLTEQRRIAELLDRADAVQWKREESRRLVDELQRSVFLEMFGDPVRNEKGWEVAELVSVAAIQGGLQVTPKRTQLPLQIPYLRVANVYRGRLDLAELKMIGAAPRELSRTRLQTGDLLVVEGHGNPDELGRCAVWDGTIEVCTHQNHLIRIRPDSNRVASAYLETFLNSVAGRRQFAVAGKTTSGLNTISTSQVAQLRIPVPPLLLQQQYHDRGEAIRSLRNAHSGRSSSLQFLCASLQHSLLARAN